MSDVIVAIVGTGVIGTSIGLALKRNDDPPTLVGHDKESKHTRQAMKMGAFDKTEWNLINATEPADLIILALPATEIKATLEAIAPHLKKDVIITDTSESKQDVVAIASEILPPHAHFVGGNPIISAPPGPENARADLFEKHLYCLTPAAKVLPDAVQLMEDFVALIGATTYYLDPAEHDGLMSGIHSLPILLSTALIMGVSGQPSWVEMRKLAGGLFSQAASGAEGDPDVIANRLLVNKESALRWLDIAVDALSDLKRLIDAEDREGLAKTLDEAIVTHLNWKQDFEANKLSNLQEPTASMPRDEPGMFQRIFFGNLFGARRRRPRSEQDETHEPPRR
jgi:prephenate dehydrogenase